MALLEYFERRAFGRHLDASRLFLYKVTLQLLGFTGDDGGTLRDTMKAMVSRRVPPEKYWPYDVARFNEDPSAFCFSFAQNYQALKYFRLDPPGTMPAETLNHLKKSLAAQMPVMFGFSVYSSMPPLEDGKGDTLEGGHAVVAVGYDDKKKIGEHLGALLIRNSWGTSWGDKGYGWLPYAFVEHDLADDFWTMVQASFVDTELFK